MDNSKVKLCSSLQWLSGFVQTSAQTETVRQLLLNPYGDYGRLSDKVVTLLTNPSLYLGIYKAVFPYEEDLEPGTFWPLIQRLAKRGVYILENNEVAVNHSVLAQTNPFRAASHLALIDGLMTAHATSVVTVGSIVKAVRRISTFNPSQELPCGVEDSLLLWLNKVSEAVCRNQKEQLSEMIQDPNVRQRRRNRLKMVSAPEPSIPLISNLCSGIRDGQCLAALLIHYFPEMVRWSDFCFSNKVLSEAQCLHNLKKVREFCSSHLSSPAFHLNPEDLLAFSQSSLLKTNILALLAHLFWSFEVKSPTCGERTETTAATQNGVNNLASNQSLFKKDHSKRNIPPSRCSLSSYSLTDLPSQTQLDITKTVVPSLRRHRLSSYSTSALLEDTRNQNGGQELSSGSTVFNAPIRSSLTAPQAAALAGFSEKAKELITASTENLHIREQMLSERRNWGRGHPIRYAASLNSSGGSSSKSSAELSTSEGADVSGNCTESWPVTKVMSTNPSLSSKPPQTLGGKLSEIPPQLCSNTPPKSSQFYTNLQNEVEVRRSITLNKHHTVASASAAGLPIIISHLDDTPDQDEGARATNPVALKASNLTTAIAMPPPDEVPQLRSCDVSSSTSSTSSTPTVVHLRLHPQAAEGKSLVDSASIPSEIVELKRQLRLKEVDIRRQQAVLEKELEGERQKFHQRVFFAIMQGTRENKTPAISVEDEHSKPQPVPDLNEGSQTVASNSSSSTFLKPAVEYPSPHKHPRIGPLSENGVGKEATPSWTNHCSTRKKPPHVTLRRLEQLPFSPILPISNPGEGPPTSLEPHNPWADPLRQDGKHSEVPVMPVSHEDVLRRREQQFRARLEEREKARKTGAEQRRKEQLMSAIHEQTEKPPPSLETSEDTLHFKLSDQKSGQVSEATAAAGPPMATYLSHNGPECYTRPKTKSNKKIIRNAICHVCLAGEANVSAKQRALAELDASTASHYLVLFRYTIGFKFRALYSFVPETDQISKVFGNGPRVIRSHMISHLYKYNSGAKEFKEILTKSFSISVDALTIKNDYWTCKKTKPPSGAFR